MATVRVKPFKPVMAIMLSMLLALSDRSFLSLVFADSGDIFVHDLPPEWHTWKAEHGKLYRTVNEEMRRHSVWAGNMKLIKKHNADYMTYGYTLRMNHLGDLVSSNT